MFLAFRRKKISDIYRICYCTILEDSPVKSNSYILVDDWKFDVQSLQCFGIHSPSLCVVI